MPLLILSSNCLFHTSTNLKKKKWNLQNNFPFLLHKLFLVIKVKKRQTMQISKIKSSQIKAAESWRFSPQLKKKKNKNKSDYFIHIYATSHRNIHLTFRREIIEKTFVSPTTWTFHGCWTAWLLSLIISLSNYYYNIHNKNLRIYTHECWINYIFPRSALSLTPVTQSYFNSSCEIKENKLRSGNLPFYQINQFSPVDWND